MGLALSLSRRPLICNREVDWLCYPANPKVTGGSPRIPDGWAVNDKRRRSVRLMRNEAAAASTAAIPDV
jgi:hypothetical protein